MYADDSLKLHCLVSPCLCFATYMLLIDGVCPPWLQVMGEQLHRQNATASSIGQKAESSHDTLRDVQRNARRDFKLRVK